VKAAPQLWPTGERCYTARGGTPMPDTLDHIDPLPAEPTDPPAEHDPFLMTQDEAIRHHAHGLVRLRWGNGELAAYRGEYIIAGPDASVLGHNARLKLAREQAAPEAAARGIPPEHQIMYYVPTLDD
jgi:hypothetical protein